MYIYIYIYILEKRRSTNRALSPMLRISGIAAAVAAIAAAIATNPDAPSEGCRAHVRWSRSIIASKPSKEKMECKLRTVARTLQRKIHPKWP